MPLKINIADKSGKTYKLELETEEFNGKEIGSKISGKILLADLNDYEFEITGASDKAGFTSMKEVSGTGLKKILIGYGKGMHKKPRKEGKKKQSNSTPKGLKLRKTVRGKVLSPDTVQINLKPVKEGVKLLSQVFPDQNKAPETEKPAEQPVESSKEVKPEEKKIANSPN